MKKFNFLIIFATLIIIIYLYLYLNKEKSEENLEIRPLKNLNTYLNDHDIEKDNPSLKSFSTLYKKSSTDIIFEEKKINANNDNLEDFDNNLLNKKILDNKISKIDIDEVYHYIY